MPRLAPSLFRRAGRISPHLATLLPACRTIASAQSELRWIREHVLDVSRSRSETEPAAGASAGRLRAGLDPGRRSDAIEAHVARLVARRGAGEPLQYVLGSQPFADLDIGCAKGVLIPRPETEAWTSMLADLVFSSPGDHWRGDGGELEEDGRKQDVRILDLCSGTGCIGLSLYARGIAAREGWDSKETGQESPSWIRPPRLRVFGFDVEPRAVRLARRNLLRNFHGGATEDAVTFQQADIFTDGWIADLDDARPGGSKDQSNTATEARRRKIDLLVSNPPYVSHRGFAVDTGRSVRNHEPKIALVPTPTPTPAAGSGDAACAPEDVFYARLLDLADALRPRVAAFEVGDMAQAIRVMEMAVARSQVQHPIEEQTGAGSMAGTSNSPRWDVVEIWRDWPDCRPEEAEEDVVLVGGREIPVRGRGHGRVVFLAEGRIMRNRFANRGFRRVVYAD